MKVILRGYGIRMTSEERQIARALAEDMNRTRGTAQKPQPPRDIICQSGPRGLLLSWKLPEGFNADIQRWRVYKDDESTLYVEINDRGTRQHFIETTAGATPPVVNVFVSSINALGVESQKVQAQGKSAIEAGAPTMPSAPPAFTGYSRRSGTCFTASVPIRTPDGLVEFGKLPAPSLFFIENETGKHSAQLVVHENYKGPIVVLENDRMVTPGHFMKSNGIWIPAEEKYHDLPIIHFEGTLYNMRVLSEKEEDFHYILWNGDAAHNSKAFPE